MEFFSKIVQCSVKKKCSTDQKKTCSQIPQICKIFEITSFYWRLLQTDLMIGTIKMPDGINNWLVETYRKKLEKLSE